MFSFISNLFRGDKSEPEQPNHHYHYLAEISALGIGAQAPVLDQTMIYYQPKQQRLVSLTAADTVIIVGGQTLIQHCHFQQLIILGGEHVIVNTQVDSGLILVHQLTTDGFYGECEAYTNEYFQINRRSLLDEEKANGVVVCVKPDDLRYRVFSQSGRIQNQRVEHLKEDLYYRIGSYLLTRKDDPDWLKQVIDILRFDEHGLPQLKWPLLTPRRMFYGEHWNHDAPSAFQYLDEVWNDHYYPDNTTGYSDKTDPVLFMDWESKPMPYSVEELKRRWWAKHHPDFVADLNILPFPFVSTIARTVSQGQDNKGLHVIAHAIQQAAMTDESVPAQTISTPTLTETLDEGSESDFDTGLDSSDHPEEEPPIVEGEFEQVVLDEHLQPVTEAKPKRRKTRQSTLEKEFRGAMGWD